VHLAGGEPILTPVGVLGNGTASVNNPLEGIKEFTVFLPGRTDDFEKKIFIQELEKIGVAKIFTTARPPIDPIGMGTGMILRLGISKLDVLGNPDSATMEISLTLNTSVEVVKTKHPCEAHIWETNAFVIEKNIMDGVKKTLKLFVNCYKEANPDSKPNFYVYF
jgi:hypothetical protein